MIRAAGHAPAVSRLRVTEQQLAPFVPFYRVRNTDCTLFLRLDSSAVLGGPCTAEGYLCPHILKTLLSATLQETAQKSSDGAKVTRRNESHYVMYFTHEINIAE